ncbi:hypothetical protein ICN46_10810 [Polynucleobacter sp. Latsch14-2]|uniref:hypothetical protein n=1 Tax=Polynucleobacter sp. Latsch14-2 TaxID=2576920 RepID=UPI001C0BECE4|nr:hypothetical protein [Polynucleobacter sp. Latsch14-2]MBU3615381.1 hypothetical protein [Polynucleobacter sp. Latsch14-2]
MSNIISSNQLVISKTLISEADGLASEYESFYSNYIVAGRTALYQSLGKMYALAQKLDQSADKQEQVASMRKILSEKYNIRTQENTSDVAVLVRYITRADRKTTHVYARAIEAAKANEVPELHFARYLEQEGGVERIRAEGAESADTDLSKRLGIAKMYLNARRAFPLTSFKLNPKSTIQLEGSSDLNVLICSESEGRQYVLAKLPIDSTLEKKVLDGLLQQLPNDLRNMSRQVTEFHKKAIKKQSKNTFKAIVKKRPVLAAGMLRIKRIRNLTAQSNNQSI